MRLVLLAAALALTAGCRRYEYRREVCPPPTSHSAIAWQYTAAHPGAVEGVVLSIDSLAPLEMAVVRLPPATRRWSTNKAGRFRLDSVVPGAHTLRITRLGYSIAETQMVMRADSGVQVVASMEEHAVLLDECGYAVLRVRRPWWKFW